MMEVIKYFNDNDGKNKNIVIIMMEVIKIFK